MHRRTSKSNGPYIPRDQNLRLVTSLLNVGIKGTGRLTLLNNEH